MMKKILFSLVAFVSLVGCVKEKDLVCYSGLLLRYSYELNPERTNRFGADVDKLTILVYDSGDRFYEMLVVDTPSLLTNDNLIHLDLPDGVWTVVTWGGDISSYNLGLLDASGEVRSHDYANGRGGSSLSEHRLWIRDYTMTEEGSKLVTGTLSPLYYGYVEAIESDTATRPAEVVEVAMVRNTNTLAVRLTGLQPEVAGGTRAHEDNMTVSADMVNGRCRADNGICDHALNVHYAQTHAISSGATTLSVDLEVMRIFTGDDDSVITVSGLSRHGFDYDTIEIPIVETIMDSPDYNTQEDLDRENYYEFALDFDIEMNLTVTINGWTVVNVIPGIK